MVHSNNNKTDKTMKAEEIAEKGFDLHGYGKSQLATAYNPDLDEKSAVRKLNRWIKAKPGLSEALSQTGLKPCAKCYTPAQVRMIIEALGAP